VKKSVICLIACAMLLSTNTLFAQTDFKAWLARLDGSIWAFQHPADYGGGKTYFELRGDIITKYTTHGTSRLIWGTGVKLESRRFNVKTNEGTGVAEISENGQVITETVTASSDPGWIGRVRKFNKEN